MSVWSTFWLVNPSYPGFCTTSLNTLTASSLDIFSKLTSFTCKIISPGSIRPSNATAPLNTAHKYITKQKMTKTTSLPFHYGPNVNPTVPTLIALSHYWYAQKVDSVHIQSYGDYVQRHGRVSYAGIRTCARHCLKNKTLSFPFEWSKLYLNIYLDSLLSPSLWPFTTGHVQPAYARTFW